MGRSRHGDGAGCRDRHGTDPGPDDGTDGRLCAAARKCRRRCRSEARATQADVRSDAHNGRGVCCQEETDPRLDLEKLLRVRSALLPLVRKLNVAMLRLAPSLACAAHPGLLATFFKNLISGS